MRLASVSVWPRAPSWRSSQPCLSTRELMQAAVGLFGLARDRLLLGADFGEMGALAGDVVAHGGEFGFQIGGRRQFGQSLFGLGAGGGGLVAAGGQARLRLRPEPTGGRRCG